VSPPPEPLRVRLLVAAFRLLVLPLYPRGLRRDFAPEIVDELRCSLRESADAGSGILRIWYRAVADLRSARRLARQPSPVPGPLPGDHRGPGGRLPRGEGIVAVFVQDLGYALRSFRRQPAFIVAVLAILAVSIGAGAAVFSIANGYLLAGLPYPEPERIGRVATFPVGGDYRAHLPVVSQLGDVDWPQQDEVFEHVAAWDLDGFTILNGDRPEAVLGSWVAPGYFGILGVEPALGRSFNSAEAGRGRESVAVISHRLWQGAFGGDPDILGRTFTAYSTDRPEDAETFTIIGVLGEDFWYFGSPFTDVLLPLEARRTPSLVRLRPGVSFEQAGAHLTAVARAHVDATSAPDWRMEVVPALESHVRQVRPVLFLMMGVVGLVLLIACGNLAVLLLVRAVGREHEIDLRRSLGASPGRIFRQLLTEGLLLAAIAGGVGLLLARFAVDALGPVVQQHLGTAIPGGADALAIDGRVLLVALTVSTATGLIFGLVPALGTTRRRLGALLREGSRGGADSARRQAARNLLIVAEVALSLTLLLGAGLMARSALHLHGLDLGFEPERLLKVNVSMREASYPHAELRLQFVERLLAGARALPGVESIALVSSYPFRGGSASGVPVQADGGAPEGVEAAVHIAGEGYLEAMGIPLLQGRWLTAADRSDAEPVAVISDSLAERLWPGENAMGRQLRAPGMMEEVDEAPWRTVVGVVGRVRKSLTEEHVPDLYVSYADTTTTFFYLMARTRGEPMEALPGLHRVVWGIDPEQPLGEPQPMSEVVTAAGARPRFLASLLGGFALFAACLALFGLYAVIAYAVVQRQRDVAVRIAVGAQRADVVGLFVRQGMLVVGAGMLAGLLASRWLVAGLESQLYGVAALDPTTYVVVVAALATAALLAVFVPARRAAACDPMRLLRQE